MELTDRKKVALQLLLVVIGVVLTGFGIWRGEAAAVLDKAIRLCLECVGIG